jgi:type II secretory pathway pseudopilin PulG
MLRPPTTLRNCKIAKLQNRSRGYILIALMLFLALLAVAALAVLPDLAFQVKRDREEEMIHRGVAYSRGVRRYFRKFGRYPTRLEDLESSNNLRFIRKRYKDPITDDDFTLLRYGDPRLAGIMLGQPGVQPAPGVQSAPSAAPPPAPASNPTQSSTTTTDSSTSNPQTNSNPSTPSSSSSSATTSSTTQVLGGGPILGVASASTAQSIREFNGKNHYKDWLFIYSQMGDRGGLPNAPYQPNLNSMILPQVRPGTGSNPNLPPGVNPQPPNPSNPGNPMPPMQ